MDSGERRLDTLPAPARLPRTGRRGMSLPLRILTFGVLLPLLVATILASRVDPSTAGPGPVPGAEVVTVPVTVTVPQVLAPSERRPDR